MELAVRNAVLCARMKAHQKSQLVRLLSKGLQVPDYHTLKVPLPPRLVITPLPYMLPPVLCPFYTLACTCLVPFPFASLSHLDCALPSPPLTSPPLPSPPDRQPRPCPPPSPPLSNNAHTSNKAHNRAAVCQTFEPLQPNNPAPQNL